MNGAAGTPAFRTQDRIAAPVGALERPADVIETLFQRIQGGEQHLRPPLAFSPPFLKFIELGYALRACLEDKARRDYLIARLLPQRRYIIGTLPASIMPHGLLPREAPPANFRPLEAFSDAEVAAWLVEDGSLIYGELQRYELDNYFDAIAPLLPPGGVMVDLGSGLGKVVMSAALALPFERCIGVELLAYRHGLALERRDQLLALAHRGLASLPLPLGADTPLTLPCGAAARGSHLLELGARIAFIESDMFKVDVGGASLVFLYSTCFSPLMDAIAAKLARELREGALVSTTTYELNHPAFTLLKRYPAGTVAWTTVLLYRRSGPLDDLPSAETRHLYVPDAAQWEAQARQDMAAMDARAAA